MSIRPVLAAAALLLALAGCSSQPAATSTAAAPTSAAPAPAASSSFDAGTLDATSSYLAALGRVDSKLTGDTQSALDKGQQVCVDIEERRTQAEQEKNVATRFAVPAAQAKKILALTKQSLCLN